MSRDNAKRVVADTSVWLDFLNGVANLQSNWLYEHLAVDTVVLPDLVLCEILRGTRDDADSDRIQGRLAACEIVATGGQTLAVKAASNYRLLRGYGLTVRSIIDCILATYCVQEGLSLLHRDRDFDGFEEHLGLKVIRPLVQ